MKTTACLPIDAHRVVFLVVLLGAAQCGFGQGYVALQNRAPSVVITHVYLGGDHQIAGNGSNDFPAGSQDWTGFTALAGSGYTAQLWAADGADQPESSLQPAAPSTDFLVAMFGAGTFTSQMVFLPNVRPNDTATVTVRVWDNQGGTVTTWALAQATGVALGESPLFNVPLVGAFPDTAPFLVGLQSFNIYQVPEPSVLTFTGLGAVTLWILRRTRQ